MTPLRPLALAVLLPAAIAFVPDAALASSAPSSTTAATALPLVAPDTTFKPEGRYALDLSVGGQALAMTFTAEKKPDGTYSGLFKHDEMGEFTTTSFKVEGRKLLLSIETPGGPAKVELTVNADNTVEGAWGMEGDGSKIAGKKVS